MRTRAASLNARWIAAGRSHTHHDGSLLAGVVCIVIAVVLYALAMLVLGEGGDDETVGWSSWGSPIVVGAPMSTDIGRCS